VNVVAHSQVCQLRRAHGMRCDGLSGCSSEAYLPATPYMAAIEGFGATHVAHVERYRLDGTRCGMVTGRHAAWNWAYRVRAVDSNDKTVIFDMGRSLVEARSQAARYAATIVETWDGGAIWKRGTKGGLRRAS
jgi:hypothetical protein